jgi:hypothetical protein
VALDPKVVHRLARLKIVPGVHDPLWCRLDTKDGPRAHLIEHVHLAACSNPVVENYLRSVVDLVRLVQNVPREEGLARA